MDTRAISNLPITFRSNIWTTLSSTISLFEVLNSIRIGTYHSKINHIRDLYTQGNIKAYKTEKKKLPVCLFSGIISRPNHKFNITGYTSLIVVDIDRLENLEIVKSKLQADPHIISAWKSPTGNGLKALLYIEYSDYVPHNDIWILHEHCAFPGIRDYMANRHDIDVDHTGGDITRLCFISSDPDIHLKSCFEPFVVHPTLKRHTIEAIRSNYHSRINGTIKATSASRKSARSAIRDLKNVTTELSSTGNRDSYNLNALTNKMCDIFNKTLIAINSTDFDSALFLIDNATKLHQTIIANVPSDLSIERATTIAEKLSGMSGFVTYLKSISNTYDDPPAIIDTPECCLSLSVRNRVINNLRNRLELKKIISELKSESSARENERRQMLILQANDITAHGFKGGGCSRLRKWARGQMNTIPHK